MYGTNYAIYALVKLFYSNFLGEEYICNDKQGILLLQSNQLNCGFVIAIEMLAVNLFQNFQL